MRTEFYEKWLRETRVDPDTGALTLKFILTGSESDSAGFGRPEGRNCPEKPPTGLLAGQNPPFVASIERAKRSYGPFRPMHGKARAGFETMRVLLDEAPGYTVVYPKPVPACPNCRYPESQCACRPLEDAFAAYRDRIYGTVYGPQRQPWTVHDFVRP